MTTLLVIGEVSLDRLYLPDRAIQSLGGAGMYTAMAARRCGVHVTMFGLRPDPCTAQLRPVAERLTEWLGPGVPLTHLPRFVIAYRNGQTEYLEARRGAEPTLDPGMLPNNLSGFDLLHVTPKADPDQQLSFVEACRQRGAAGISAGTDLDQAREQPSAVRAVMEQSDLFFMNETEAAAVFGSPESARTEPGKVLFITLGARGARVIQGEASTSIPAPSATVLDPTGAGDTFCGATLAYLLQKEHPAMAARHAVTLAAEMIGQVGPNALFSDASPPRAWLDTSVRVDDGQIERIARAVTTLADASLYPLVGPSYPPKDHLNTVDYFFATTLQQFSFWTSRNGRYHRPLIALIGGVARKGSDYLWFAITRQLEVDTEFCSPQRQASLSRDELLSVFRADDGRDPMPALDLHLEQARQYGRDMLALGLTPQKVLDSTLASSTPLDTFLLTLDHIAGYKEDPLRKKSLLLAMILKDRPEGFLPLRDSELQKPIVDYHLMRFCLRTGLIDVVDKDLRKKLVTRQLVSPAEEWAVRFPAYLALEQVLSLSGRGLSAVNNFVFTNTRKVCPEMIKPACPLCQLDAVCAHRKDFFQPVLRTTFY